MWVVLVAVVLMGEPNVLQGAQVFKTEAECNAYREKAIPLLTIDLAKADPTSQVVESRCVEAK